MKKSRKPINTAVQQLDGLLRSGDIEGAQSFAATIAQQLTTVPAPTAPLLSGVTVPLELVARTNQRLSHKAACLIAETFYRHAEIELAKQWADTCDLSMNDQFSRRVRLLLGHIAFAMDRDADAIAHYTSLITAKNLYREQPAAYSGLLELLQLTNQDAQIEEWVRHGQNKFQKAGGMQRRFFWTVSRTLRRRNHPLWREINSQIVASTREGRKWRLKAHRELASDARKFGRYEEAEIHYRAICSQPLKSTRDTVNLYLFLAEAMAKQGKSPDSTVDELRRKANLFERTDQRDYARYRIAKFYDSVGRHDLAEVEYAGVATGSGAWAAAALTMQAKLAEKLGRLRPALGLYLEYVSRFPQKPQHVLQAYGNALSIAEKLADAEASEQILAAIANPRTVTPDYSLHLNIAFYLNKHGKNELATRYLESGLALSRQALKFTSEPAKRCRIHFESLRRMNDFQQHQRMIGYFSSNHSDLDSPNNENDDFRLQCMALQAYALNATGNRARAIGLLNTTIQRAEGRHDVQGKLYTILALFYESSGERARADEVFQVTLEGFPTHPWTNISRVELAIRALNRGDPPSAKKLCDEVIKSLPENSRMDWIQKAYWSAVYLLGVCLIAQGNENEGRRMKQSATERFPNLDIQRRIS